MKKQITKKSLLIEPKNQSINEIKIDYVAPKKIDIIEKIEKTEKIKIDEKINFDNLQSNQCYLIVNEYCNKPKKNIAIFDRYFTDFFNNHCALFCVDKNIFALSEKNFAFLKITKLNAQKMPIYSMKKLSKHYEKFNEFHAENCPINSLKNITE